MHLLSDVDLQDEPVKVQMPLDLDRMGSWRCVRLDMRCDPVERDGSFHCRRCGLHAPQFLIGRVVRFTRKGDTDAR